MDNEPEFEPSAAAYATTTLFQALLLQLIESGVLSVADTERVFDIALERAKKVRDVSPDSERLIEHLYEKMKFDRLYRWAGEQKAKRTPPEDHS
jgi:hypothetical protein